MTNFPLTGDAHPYRNDSGPPHVSTHVSPWFQANGSRFFSTKDPKSPRGSESESESVEKKGDFETSELSPGAPSSDGTFSSIARHVVSIYIQLSVKPP